MRSSTSMLASAVLVSLGSCNPHFINAMNSTMAVASVSEGLGKGIVVARRGPRRGIGKNFDADFAATWAATVASLEALGYRSARETRPGHYGGEIRSGGLVIKVHTRIWGSEDEGTAVWVSPVSGTDPLPKHSAIQILQRVDRRLRR